MIGECRVVAVAWDQIVRLTRCLARPIVKVQRRVAAKGASFGRSAGTFSDPNNHPD